MKKILYKLLFVIICISLVNICNISYAGSHLIGNDATQKENTTTKHTIGEIIQEGDSFISTGEQSPKIEDEDLKNMSDTIYNVLLTLGILVAFIIGGILGIKFITEGIEGKAEVKSMLVPYVFGCIIIFGAFTIWKIIVTILSL